MAVERKRLVLRENVYVAQSGIHAIGKCDVNDAVVAAKGDRGFGAVSGEGIKALSGAARQQNSQRVVHKSNRRSWTLSKLMLSEKEKARHRCRAFARSGYASSSTLMRRDFRKRTS